ncbi:hypothetical protein ACGFNU_38310 [Spirillospora sp. NPDC048911]|uniref:hypothetical protein n=1 Tax=Spirillospora sp. NPDC048911 TaxID=3364527 RepID=UPI00370FA1E6
MAKSKHHSSSKLMQGPTGEPETPGERCQIVCKAARRIATSRAAGARMMLAGVAAVWVVGAAGTLPASAQPADGPPTLPRLSMQKQASLSSARPGQRFSYVLRVRNVGLVPAYGVKLADHMPAGLNVTKVRGPGCRGKATAVSCRWKQIGYRRSISVRVAVRVSPSAKGSGRLRNRAVLTYLGGRKAASHTLRLLPLKPAPPKLAAPNNDPQKPAVHKPAAHKPAAHKPVAHKPVAHRPAAHKPLAHKPAAHEPAPHRPRDAAEKLPHTGMSLLTLAALVTTGVTLLLAGAIICWRTRRSRSAASPPEADEVARA